MKNPLLSVWTGALPYLYRRKREVSENVLLKREENNGL